MQGGMPHASQFEAEIANEADIEDVNQQNPQK